MTKKTVPDMKELFRQAAEIAQQVPDNMQEAAFNRALDLLVEGSDPTGQASPQVKSRTKPSSGQQEDRIHQDAGNLLSQIDSTQHPGVRSATKVLDRALMVLQIAWDNHSVDGLSATEISQILTEKFRLGTTRQAVGMALKDASNLVDRVPEGRGYRYRIMSPGEDYLSHLEDGQGPEHPSSSRPSSKKRPTNKPGKKKKANRNPDPSKINATGKGKTSAKPKAKRGSSSKLGPKSAITGLIEEGFFAAPKTGPEVQLYLKKKRGFDLGIDQLRLAMLRLVRDGEMERDENDEGQYEYKRS